VALRDGKSTSRRYCREFQQTITVGGKAEQAYGTACQQPDGAREVVSTNN
jgi:surface antigen